MVARPWAPAAQRGALDVILIGEEDRWG